MAKKTIRKKNALSKPFEPLSTVGDFAFPQMSPGSPKAKQRTKAVRTVRKGKGGRRK